MKLRIKGNSLRFRVSPSELMRLLESGRLEESIRFGRELRERARGDLSTVTASLAANAQQITRDEEQLAASASELLELEPLARAENFVGGRRTHPRCHCTK